jgi:hypothetical protein
MKGTYTFWDTDNIDQNYMVQEPKHRIKISVCWIWDSYSSGHEKHYLLGYIKMSSYTAFPHRKQCSLLTNIIWIAATHFHKICLNIISHWKLSLHTIIKFLIFEYSSCCISLIQPRSKYASPFQIWYVQFLFFLQSDKLSFSYI